MAQHDFPNVFPGAIGKSGCRVVVGIDYGVLFTTLAWAQTDGTTHQLNDIDLIVMRDWPGAHHVHVPSAISYSQTSADNQCAQWGWSIDDSARVLRYTKLELEPRSLVTELDTLRDLFKGLDTMSEFRASDDPTMVDVPQHLIKTPEEVVKDYLERVATAWYRHMKYQNRFTLERVPLDLVFTIPERWSYSAMSKFYQAASSAFRRDMFPTLRDISLVPELLATTLPVWSTQDNAIEKLIPGDCFVVCSGDETIRMATYYIEKVEPLETTKLGRCGQGPYGTGCIDTAFMAGFCRPRLLDFFSIVSPEIPGTPQSYTVFSSRVRVLLERFEKVRNSFDGRIDGNLPLPRGTRVATGFEGSIVNGVLSVTSQDMIEIFSRSLHGILPMLLRQIMQAVNESHNGIHRRVSTVILTGKLFEIPYMYQEVSNFVRCRGNIDVYRADDCFTSAVKGAVFAGMGMIMAAPKRIIPCPRHYGIIARQISEDWSVSSDEPMKHGRIVWLVKMGDAILPDQPIVANFNVRCIYLSRYKGDARMKRVMLVASSWFEPPDDQTSFSVIENECFYLDVDLLPTMENHCEKKGIGKVDSNYVVNLVLELSVSSEVELKMKYQDETLGSVKTSL